MTPVTLTGLIVATLAVIAGTLLLSALAVIIYDSAVLAARERRLRRAADLDAAMRRHPAGKHRAGRPDRDTDRPTFFYR